VLIILSILGYIFNWDWTGLGPYISPPHPKDSDYQRGKTLWDWLQLLIIPAVLAVAGYVINLTISRGEQEATEQRAQSEREAAEKRAQTEREIAQDNQREAALQEYIDNMSELLLDRKLRESPEDDEIRKIARVRTLTILPRLDASRISSVLQFLYESDLIDKDKCIVDLSGADLSNVHLEGAKLEGAKLSGANLTGADLTITNMIEADLQGSNLATANLLGADLREANLSGANLNEAELTGADLTGACLHKAFLMGTYFSEANLNKADLSRAKLSGANLSEADLSGADLTYANLNAANVTEEQLAKAKSLKGATMPDGSIHP